MLLFRTVYKSDVFDLLTAAEESNGGRECSLLFLVPVRLGGEQLNHIYFPCLQVSNFFHVPFSVSLKRILEALIVLFVFMITIGSFNTGLLCWDHWRSSQTLPLLHWLARLVGEIFRISSNWTLLLVLILTFLNLVQWYMSLGEKSYFVLVWKWAIQKTWCTHHSC